ncbi:uncharacterized protein [Nicotiana tomentosiformis]|uniref:uncharacterized protein n=1 Tax=Nicotiana tomentosiformis TaxID=4098 RepID=UPI00388CD928
MVHSQEWVKREAKRPRGSGYFSGVPSGGQFYRGKGRSYRHTQMGHPTHCGVSVSHSSYSADLGQSSFSALPVQVILRVIRSSSFVRGWGCFECRELNQYKRDCPRLLSEAPQHSSRPRVPAPAVTPPAQPTRGGGQAAKGLLRGGGRSGGSQARFYAFPAKPDAIASDAVITGIVSVCHREASILFDLGSTYSYVS